MSFEDISPEKLATLLHHYREALAPDFGLISSASPDWEELSAPERQRMIAATRLALLDLRTSKLPCDYGNMPPFSAPPTGGTEGKECGC